MPVGTVIVLEGRRHIAAGADDADIRRWPMRTIPMAKGLAQEVMLDERSAASARETLEDELAGFESWRG